MNIDILNILNSRGFSLTSNPEWIEPQDKNIIKYEVVNHPFIGYKKNPPNSGNPVNDYEQLRPAKLNLTKTIRGHNNIMVNTIGINIPGLENLGLNLTTQQIPLKVPITEDMKLLDIIQYDPPATWEEVFMNSISEFDNIQIKIDAHEISGTKILPLRKDIFRAFHLTALSEVRVVILGQDPYHSVINGVPKANGMSFSVTRGTPIPPSLRNIFIELAREIPNFNKPEHGDLSAWARQGVLMLNTCLTVNPGTAGSHGNIWNGFITRILMAIEQANPRAIFVLWGSKAQFIKKYISNKSTILESTHPSPFSANKSTNNNVAFFGCDHFIEINKILLGLGQRPIDWNLDQ